MDKLHEEIKGEDQRKSELFKALFQFQTQLERYDDGRFHYRLKIQELMFDIDELLTTMIEETESNYLE